MVFVPTIIERNASSERVYDLYSCLLKERIIILTGEIDDAMSSSICAQLLYLSSISSEPIQMYINSPGGSVSAGLAIYDIMKYIRCDVSTICMGICFPPSVSACPSERRAAYLSLPFPAHRCLALAYRFFHPYFSQPPSQWKRYPPKQG